MRNLSLDEKKWIDIITAVDFNGGDIIKKQFEHAKVEASYTKGYIEIKFILLKDIDYDKFPFDVRVPVEIRFSEGNFVPTVMLLHVVDGFIDQLEIFKADSSELSKDFGMENIEVIIDEKLRSKQCIQ